MRNVEWNEEEIMTDEFALTAMDEIQCFYRRLYYFPEMKPFSNSIDFENAIEVLNGLKEYIKSKIKEQ